jgi:G:T-mismatch repair DNA endonuclease (very short patch repair protein)
MGLLRRPLRVNCGGRTIQPALLGQYCDKVRRTQQRDREPEKALRALGYTMVRFWDFEVKADVSACVAAIEVALRQAGRL